MPNDRSFRPGRRTFLKAILASSVMPWCLPARILGADGQTAPSNQIRLGVIGAGAQGHYDMRVFLGQKDVRVVAVCDVNQKHLEDARRAIQEVYGKSDVKLLADYRELNADPGIDAVLMALPVHWHSLPSFDAIRQGKHIYHEKPMAMSFEEAQRVRQAVRKKGVVFQFGTQQRSDLNFRWACELALNGRLGKVNEIEVSVPGGKKLARLAEQPVPQHLDWNRWVGPAPQTPYHEELLNRDTHENVTRFSLGMISCWGIHHLDIAQWGNGTDPTGPISVQGEGEFPTEGACDAILRWKVRFEFAQAAPVVFVNDGTAGFEHGIRFRGASGWVHVNRSAITASDDKLLKDPRNRAGSMPVRLPASDHHVRDFVQAIKNRTRAICDIETAVRSDTLCQLGLIAVKQGRKLAWDPQAERFTADDAANAQLKARPFRDGWTWPDA